MLDSYLKIWLGTEGNATRKTNFESEVILGQHIWVKICWYLKHTDEPFCRIACIYHAGTAGAYDESKKLVSDL